MQTSRTVDLTVNAMDRCLASSLIDFRCNLATINQSETETILFSDRSVQLIAWKLLFKCYVVRLGHYRNAQHGTKVREWADIYSIDVLIVNSFSFPVKNIGDIVEYFRPYAIFKCSSVMRQEK